MLEAARAQLLREVSELEQWIEQHRSSLSGSLTEALRLSARRPENARTVASLMHAIDRFRRPRVESVLTTAELAAITAPTTFILGSDDPYLSVKQAQPSIAQIPGATLHEVPGAHAPWLVDARHCARLIAAHPGLGCFSGSMRSS